ncbi:ferredoxin--NADP reductase [Aminobacter ciceronei]|uniref:Ferredoxin-NADP reductase n=1 Tax=Aminobacter ciceronei TaxID=150723 RepID=Q93S69_9HYPH|nr:ferredoxin--NADP reductase [Aminobacter ciceronei]AAK38767.1 reductase PaaE [Aminobacter ciceronei]MBA8907990.1 ferredoxin-NADP reductase [Aminobacter ciceronei]MBA9021745.1 ferredoxin-NADP reductase [Aminobacter ciceronei]
MATYHLKIVGKRDEGNDAASLWLEVPQDLRGAFSYRPGQFLTVERDGDGGRIARQYSLSSTPEAHRDLRITVKKIDGGAVSPWLVQDVGEGQALEVQPPRGRFFRGFDEPRHVLMLACGSGIAPILSIARHLLAQDAGHRVTIIYGNRTPDAVILGDEVGALAESHPTACHVEQVMSRAGESWHGARGRIDKTFIETRWKDWQAASHGLSTSIFLCGPQEFMDDAERAFVDLGLALADIHRESFDLVLNDDDGEPGLTLVGVNDPGESGPCERIVAVVGGEEYETVPEEGESILAALIRAEADVPFSCQEGTCASCISKLTEGSASVRPGVLQTLRQDDLDEGLTLACLSRPTTRSVRIDFDEI